MIARAGDVGQEVAMGRASRRRRGELGRRERPVGVPLQEVDGRIRGTWHRVKDRPDLVGEMEWAQLRGATRVRCQRCEEEMPVGELRVEWDRNNAVGGRGEWFVMCGQLGCHGGGPGLDLWPVDPVEEPVPLELGPAN